MGYFLFSHVEDAFFKTPNFFEKSSNTGHCVFLSCEPSKQDTLPSKTIHPRRRAKTRACPLDSIHPFHRGSPSVPSGSRGVSVVLVPIRRSHRVRTSRPAVSPSRQIQHWSSVERKKVVACARARVRLFVSRLIYAAIDESRFEI